MRDPYRVLGVKSDCSERELKRAMRKLSKKYHPDMSVGDREAAEKKFCEMQNAYEEILRERTLGRIGCPKEEKEDRASTKSGRNSRAKKKGSAGRRRTKANKYSVEKAPENNRFASGDAKSGANKKTKKSTANKTEKWFSNDYRDYFRWVAFILLLALLSLLCNGGPGYALYIMIFLVGMPIGSWWLMRGLWLFWKSKK